MSEEDRRAPARASAQRKIGTLEKLRNSVDLWIASASANGRAYLVPLSYYWDGSRLSLATRVPVGPPEISLKVVFAA